MTMNEEDFSSLTTVSSFDGGESSCKDIVNQDDAVNLSPSSLLVESLVAQLSILLEEDPQKQQKLYLNICQALRQMNLVGKSYKRDDLQILRTQYQQALCKFLNRAKLTNVDNRETLWKTLNPIPQLSNGIINWSRYSTEFEELAFIAHGGFGSVYKARHRLDGGLYAVKKINLKVNRSLKDIMEVRTLARLNHPNIVAYKAAWLEMIEKESHQQLSIKDSENESKKSSSKSLEFIVFDKSSELIISNCSKENSSLIMNEQNNVSESSSSSLSSFSVQQKMVVHKYQMANSHFQGLSHFATLYIQMQLCQQTLRQWLDIRNRDSSTPDYNICNNIFKKVVKGVEYIHSQGIVHHDINPNNIFISYDLKEVQVGDFGLSCCIATHQSQSLLSATHPHGEVGTVPYAAPEQANGTCNPKSDIYSLGIVLFELILPFKTSMERSEMVKKLKSGNIPTDLTAKFPNWAKIISRTVASLEKRPTASELLKEMEDSNTENTLSKIKDQETINKLRRENMEKDLEIKFLKRKLREIQKQK